MATKNSKEIPLTAAQQRRVNLSASKLISEAIEIMGSGPQVTAESIRSAGIPNPVTGGRSMIDAQTFRINWYQIERKQLGGIARLVVERNWFARPVHELNKVLFGGGFRFATQEARDWAATAEAYPFRRIHDDLLEEWLISDSVCAFWRKKTEPGTLPMIEIPDMEEVDYKVVGGIPQISVTIKRDSRISESLKSRIGAQMWECIRSGKRLVIIKGDEASEYDFEVRKTGKSNGPLPVPRITGILDDLDYIEAVRTGDWNGAYSRREILRHSSKGYGVSSGPNAGTTRNNAKYSEIQAILKAMKSIMGKTDIATNFDQEIKWIAFPSEFFNPVMLEAAHQRLIFWGGLAAVLLLKTDSQVTGLSSLLHDRLRAQVIGFRDGFAPFISAIFNSESFKANFPDAPPLAVEWSVKQLYSGEGLNKFITLLATYGLRAPDSLREILDINNEIESARMVATHESPKAYTPPYEPRQGIASAFTVPDTSTGGGQSSLPGSPGRPTTE